MHAIAHGAIVEVNAPQALAGAVDILVGQNNGDFQLRGGTPVSTQHLPADASVDEFLRLAVAVLAVEPCVTTDNSTPLRLSADVLVVDDNAVNRKVVQTLLEKRQCTVHAAASGEIALAMCQVHDFDLILMDCQMPEMDGFECTRRLRAAGVKTPIVALSANAMGSDKAACLAAGMDDFLAKPAGADVLYRCVDQRARKRRL